MPFIDLKSIEEKELLPGCTTRFVHSEKMTIAYWNIKAGSNIPEHAHPHEQIANIIEGNFELNLQGKIQILTPGIVAVIPSNVKHSGKAISDCKIIDSFHPVREDYKL
ncbi:MAG: cupin domain-containing protein [Bacteroidota bacterium]